MKLVVHLLSAAVIIIPVMSAAYSTPCLFNPLCSCSNSQRDVSCIGVPFAEVPSLSVDDIFQMTMLKSGVEVLYNHSFQGTRISSLRLMQNELSIIQHQAFQDSGSTLTTLDLSFNKLQKFPQEAIQPLRHLQWLSLHSNEIEDWTGFKAKLNLRHVFLGDNGLTTLSEGAFTNLLNLTSLDLDQNLVTDIDAHVFPASLQTLSLSNNLLTEIPVAALYDLQNLTWIQLSGNLFARLPKPISLPVKHLHKLDLSHNLLTIIPPHFINSTGLSITNLHLEFNYIRTVSQAAFRGLVLERLSLSNNRLSTIPDGAFEGVQETLKALDLSYNLLEIFPKALKDLTVLSHLYLRGNSLKNLDQYDLYGCRYDLEVLDLSSNQLTVIPKESLHFTQRVSRISLQDNFIKRINSDDFAVWGQTLTALNIANNILSHISPDAFLGTTKLRELKLSYNKLLTLDPGTLKPIRSSLEILEIGNSNSVDLKLLQGMEKVKWLQMDHNSLVEIQSDSLGGMPWIIHCDFDGNKLENIPKGLFQSDVHTRLNSIMISNNNLEVIESKTFFQLPLITNIVLYGNKLKALQNSSFKDMPILNAVILARNNIEVIEKGAFSNLRGLSNVFLQHNNLTEFCFDGFSNVGHSKNPVVLNLSSNRIKHLKTATPVSDDEVFIKVRILDLSINSISHIEPNFLQPAGSSLHYLYLSSNKISSLNSNTFSKVPQLQVLHLDHNEISDLPPGTFEYTPMLQMIDLNHNRISVIASGTFRNLTVLRILDLSYNTLKSLPEDAFLGCKLERLNLSNNNIFHAPLRSLEHVHPTLRYLDLSNNRITSIPTSGLNGLPGLLSLNLSANKLTILNENSFKKLQNLFHLDLSQNSLYRVDDAPFRPLLSLQSLVLKDVSLQYVPTLFLPSLRFLDLSSNLLTNISDQSFVQVKDLRRLDLSHNYLQEVPQHVWHSVKKIRYLDISYNPIQVLSMSSFEKLSKLKELDMRGLDLKHLDSRILNNLKFLTSFKTSTYLGLRSFRLHNLLSKCHSLRRVLVEVEEPTLSHQLQWTFGAKLRELTITGRNLQYVLPDAFVGLQTHELILRITGTSINHLPKELLKYLADIRYLTLDLRGNLLTTMDEEVLSPANKLRSDELITQHISGGVLLENNPWVCSCGLVWLGHWIRRWMRETLRVQMLHFDGFLYTQNLARRTVCSVPGTNKTIPLVDLELATFGCNSNKSCRSATSKSPVEIVTFVLVVFFTVYDALRRCIDAFE